LPSLDLGHAFLFAGKFVQELNLTENLASPHRRKRHPIGRVAEMQAEAQGVAIINGSTPAIWRRRNCMDAGRWAP
jgi:hypothetical protein